MNMNYNIVWSGPKLDGKLDFYYWETLMATHLRAHNIWNFVETGLAEEASDTARRRDQLVYHRFNKELIDYSIFSIIINAKTAKGV